MAGKAQNHPRPRPVVRTPAEVIEARYALADLLARSMARVGMDYSRDRVTALAAELHRSGVTVKKREERALERQAEEQEKERAS